MTTRFRDGSVTVTLDDGLEKFVRSCLSAAETETVRILEAEAEGVASKARAEWYGPNGVTRDTGRSGDIQVVTTFDTAKSEVRVSVGSVDTRTVQAGKKRFDNSAADAARQLGGSTKPLAAFVHRPWSTTLRARAVSQDEWWAWKKKGLPALPPPTDSWWKGSTNGRKNGKGLAHGKWYIQDTSNPEGKALVSHGKGYLLVDLVRKPMRARVKAITPALGKAIASKVTRGR